MKQCCCIYFQSSPVSYNSSFPPNINASGSCLWLLTGNQQVHGRNGFLWMERISGNGTDFLSTAATISGQFQRVIPRGIHLTSQQLTWLFGFEKWNWILTMRVWVDFPFWYWPHASVGGQGANQFVVSLALSRSHRLTTRRDHQTKPADFSGGPEFSKKCVTNTLKQCQWTSHPNLTKPDEPSWLLLSVKVCKRPDLSRWPETIDYETALSIFCVVVWECCVVVL